MEFQEPVAKRCKYAVKFGVNGEENRGENVMNPAVERDDPYFWLRNETRDDVDVLKYLKQENEYTEKKMGHTKSLQEELYNEMKSRVADVDESHPYAYGDGGWNSQYRYYKRITKENSYPQYFRRNVDSSKDELILDCPSICKNYKFCDISEIQVSPNHQYLSYGIDTKGDEKYDIIIRDLQTGSELCVLNGIPEADHCWTPNSKALFYTTCDKTERKDKLWYVTLESLQKDALNILQKGSLSSQDKNQNHKLIIEEKDPTFAIGYAISDDDSFLFVETSSFDTDIMYFAPIDSDYKLEQIYEKTDGLKCDIEYHRGNLIIRTNKDNATNFKLTYVPIGQHNDKNKWVDLRPYDDCEYINGMQCFEDFIVVKVRKDCYNTIAVIKYEDGEYSKNWDFIEVNEQVYDMDLMDNYIYDTHKLRLSYESYVYPRILYEYDMVKKEMVTLKTSTIPNYDSSLYKSELIWIPSYYGVKVPVSIVYKIDASVNSKGDKEKEEKEEQNKQTSNQKSKPRAKPPKPRPFYMYGYGSYGSSIDPFFDTKKISLLDRGFIFAVAYIRGGGELGYGWYLDGKMYNKMNTFLDFIACAEYFIREGYTKPELLAIEGRSAGGLLVGAALTMRPDLFNTVIAGVPFVDVLNSMCDPKIPLTTEEWSQWGNPNKIEDYIYMKQYSPYDNLKKTDYPNTLFLAGLNDPRVNYWEPVKFTAKLRYVKTDGNCHLLKTNMESGHFGSTDRYKFMEEKAFQYAFILNNII